MPRKDTFPGTIYAQKGRNKWIIKLPSMKPVHTGLEATPENKKIARQIRERMWLESKGVGKKQSHDGTTYDVAFAQFLTVYCAQKSKKTKEGYLFAYKAIAPEDKPLTASNAEKDVLAYLASAEQRKHNQVTRNNYLRHFQTFLTWSHKRGWIERTEFAKQYRKAENTEVRNYTESECAAIVEYCRNDAREHFREMGLMIEFMLETGARPVDCLTLEWTHIKLDGTVDFLNKVHKTVENLPLSDAAIEVLKRLPKDRVKVFRWQHISLSRLRKWLNDVLTACNIPAQGRSFKEFRKTFRNRLLDAEVQPEIAMRLMRHADVRTTLKHYTKFTHESLRKGLKKVAFGSEKVAEVIGE